MKKLISLALGIVTSVGGFLEIGSIATAAQAGAGFGYQLAWTIVLGTVCIACLVEMSGRFSAVSRHTIPDAMRERFGVNFFAITLIIFLGVSLLVLAAEMGGMAAALEMATGWPIPVWGLPLAIGSCLLLWRCSFGFIENGVSLLGMVTLGFAVGAAKLHPDYGALARGMVPSLPHANRAHYWFVAVSVLGASITPSLYYFYSSGAIEEQWDVSYVGVNRAIAGLGMAFGGFLSLSVLVLAAIVFHPRGIAVEHYQQLPELLSGVFGRRGFWLVVASLLVACLGATLEIALALAYTVAQGFGWKWGEDSSPGETARFSLTYTLLVAAAALFVLIGVDPLRMTEISMSLTAASLPVGVLPFLILMNDREYLESHTNGHVGNAVVMAISALATVLAVVSIPLELFGGLTVHLIADVLDEQLQDVRGENAGRIDGIILELREGKPPRVAYLEVSPITLLARFSRRLARWYARYDRILGPGRGEPFRIPWSRVTRDGPLLRMDLTLESTPINAFENWLRRTVVARIPGMR